MFDASLRRCTRFWGWQKKLAQTKKSKVFPRKGFAFSRQRKIPFLLARIPKCNPPNSTETYKLTPTQTQNCFCAQSHTKLQSTWSQTEPVQTGLGPAVTLQQPHKAIKCQLKLKFVWGLYKQIWLNKVTKHSYKLNQFKCASMFLFVTKSLKPNTCLYKLHLNISALAWVRVGSRNWHPGIGDGVNLFWRQRQEWSAPFFHTHHWASG